MEPETQSQQQQSVPPQQNSVPQGTQPPAANNDMVMGILAYILFFIPLLAGVNSPFVRYHTNQGLVLFLFWVAGWVASMILPLLFLIIPFYSLFLFILWVLGIINVTKGEMKPLPLIGGIQILK